MILKKLPINSKVSMIGNKSTLNISRFKYLDEDEVKILKLLK
jgi:hypothetical protein